MGRIRLYRSDIQRKDLVHRPGVYQKELLNPIHVYLECRERICNS